MVTYPCVGTDTLTVCRIIVGVIHYIATFVNTTKELRCLGVILPRSTSKENLVRDSYGSFLTNILTSSKNAIMSSSQRNMVLIGR